MGLLFPYASGKVELFGMSYHGYRLNPFPFLKAIAPVMTMAEPWADMLKGDGGASQIGNQQTWTLGSMIMDKLDRKQDPKTELVQRYIQQLPHSSS